MVVHQYCGAGEIGELAAQEDQLRRAQRQAEREAWQTTLAALDNPGPSVITFRQNCDLLRAAALLLSGCHFHNRHWKHRGVRNQKT
jgi:hypothetical protein